MEILTLRVRNQSPFESNKWVAIMTLTKLHIIPLSHGTLLHILFDTSLVASFLYISQRLCPDERKYTLFDNSSFFVIFIHLL